MSSQRRWLSVNRRIVMPATRRKGRKPAAKRKTAGRRELIDTGTNKLFVRGNARGTSFAKVVDAGRSIIHDKRTKAICTALPVLQRALTG
jgi:hypothetical protein